MHRERALARADILKLRQLLMHGGLIIGLAEVARVHGLDGAGAVVNLRHDGELIDHTDEL